MLDVSTLVEKLVTRITAMLTENGETVLEETLRTKAEAVVMEGITRRSYPESYTDKKILHDLETKGYPIFLGVVLNDYNQIGAEGQSSHTENSVNRIWHNRERLWDGWFAYVQFL